MSKFSVFCLDLDSGKVLWESTAWGMHSEGQSIFGSVIHIVELAFDSKKENIAVFGITHAGNYVEAFNVDTGAPQFRFNSKLWFVK